MEEEIKYQDSQDCETYEDYCPGGYHPVYLGQRINSKYTIIQKLGWGHFSTVWLVETDEPNRQQLALKIQRSKESHAETAIDEIELLKELRKHQSDERWTKLLDCGFNISQLRQAYSLTQMHKIFRPLLLVDNFAIHGIHGKHYCSVFELMGPNLLDVIQHFEFKNIKMPLSLVKKITRDVLIGLIYMHEHVRMIHTDLKPENILIKLSDEEQTAFVNGLRGYKIKPISMKFLYNLKSKNPSKNKKKYEKKKLKKEALKNKEEAQVTEQNKETQDTEPIEETVQTEQPQPVVKMEIESMQPTNEQQQQKQYKTKKSKKKNKKQQQKKQQTKEENDKPTQAKQKVPTKGGKVKPVGGKEAKQEEPDESSMTQEISDESEEQPEKQYTQEEIDNLKWKGILINLKKDVHFKICDFGNACLESKHYTDDIQTRQYRSPEVILGHDYYPNTDIWSLACVVYELLTNSFLFKPKDKKGIGKDEDHLYKMIQLLGPLPKQFILEADNAKKYFNKKGELVHGMPGDELTIAILLEEDYGYDRQEAVQIQKFLKPMLEYEPGKRISAMECLRDPWLWS